MPSSTAETEHYGPRQRRAMQAVAVQFWMNGLVFASFLPRLPELRTRLDVDLGRLGLLLTIGAAGGLIGSLIVSPVIERIGTRKTMVGAGLVVIACLPAIGFATSPWLFLVTLVTLSVFDVLMDVGMNIQGSRLSARRATPFFNRLHALWSVGSVLGGIASAWAASRAIPLEQHLIAVAVLLLVTMVFVAPGLLPTDEVLDADGVGRTKPMIASNPADAFEGLKPSNRRALAVLGLLGAAAMIIEIAPADWAALRLSDDFGLSDGRAGAGFVAFTLGLVIARFLGDAIVSGIGEDRTLQLSVAVSLFGLLMSTVIPSATVSIIGLFITGLGVSVLFPRLYDEAAKAPGKTGAGMAAMTAGQRAGAVLAPVMIGGLAATEVLDVGAAMAIVAVPCAAVLLLVRR